MRLALLAAVVLLAGCGGPARTVLAPTPAQTSYGARGELYVRRADEVVAPVFAHARAAVMAACVLACDTYCHDAPDLVDRDRGVLHVVDVNTWTGTVPLTVTLVDLGDGTTRMDMQAEEATDFIGDSTSLQVKRMRGFADAVARHLRAAELADQVKAEGPAPGQVAAAGSGSGSATSRP